LQRLGGGGDAQATICPPGGNRNSHTKMGVLFKIIAANLLRVDSLALQMVIQ